MRHVVKHNLTNTYNKLQRFNVIAIARLPGSEHSRSKIIGQEKIIPVTSMERVAFLLAQYPSVDKKLME